MTSMQAYLASKYMSGAKADAILARAGPSTTKKKKKRQGDDADAATGSSIGTFIKDDEDELKWGKPMNVENEEEEGRPVVEKDRSFKKRKLDPSTQNKDDGGSGWITVRTGEGGAEGTDVEVQEDIASKFTGGLLQPSQLSAVLPGAASRKGKKKAETPPPEEQETVYRDASGRKLDMKLEKAAAAREKRLREEKEAQKMEWGKGLVQRDEAERRRKEEEAAKTKGLARYADDKDLNDMQKSQDRWNDPAAAFLTVCLSLRYITCLLTNASQTEKGEERSSETGVQRTAATSQPVWDQARIPMGWRWCVRARLMRLSRRYD